ncbi:MAG TPA: hypothetical protein DHU79_05660 [Clostridiales bacterium]|nr:hypothetical protein [Clostridiales bacterium]
MPYKAVTHCETAVAKPACASESSGVRMLTRRVNKADVVETNLGERRWYSGFSPFTALTFCQAWTGVFFVFGERQPFLMFSPTSRF